MKRIAVLVLAVLALSACGADKTKRSIKAQGQDLYEERGCASCHSTDGSKSVGPTWKGLFGSKVPLNDGSEVVADEAYLRDSILQPSLKTVDGFKPGLMETVIKQDSLSDEEVTALIAYIKSLR